MLSNIFNGSTSEYINSEDVFKKGPIYCKDCRNGRELIKNKKIIDFIYSKNKPKENKWIISDGKSYKYDRVLLKKSFVDTIPEICNPSVIDSESKYEVAPDIILLENHEKFKDNDGNILDIETRGIKPNIYFKVKDIITTFDIAYLDKHIIDKKDEFIENEHYKYFINKSSQNKQMKKELYLTYRGILRVLFVSRSGKTDKFISWATETLFTCQLGTKEQKEKLVGDILGISAKVIKEVFNCDANTIPCVYLFTLGYVKDLRLSMNIDQKYNDDSIVAKYGFTKELSRRTSEHIKLYNKIEGCNLKLKHYSYIDPQYISNGETDIKNFMTALNLKLVYENYDELIIIPKEYMTQRVIAEKYEHIGKKYSGHISELITKIKELENQNEKQELTHNYEIQKILHEKDKLLNEIELQKEKYEHQLLKKDYELLKIQNQILK